MNLEMNEGILGLTTNSKEFFVPRVTPVSEPMFLSRWPRFTSLNWDDKLKSTGMVIIIFLKTLK
jgi:hypothetical protein